MAMSAFVFVVIVVILGSIALAAFVARRERARREVLTDWATAHGWQTQLRPQLGFERRLPGRNRRGVSLAMSGLIDDRPVTVAEYSYTTTSNRTRTTHRYVIAVVQLREPRPSIGVYRRGALSKFGRALFGDRSTAIGYEPFDRDFRVTAEHPGDVPSVLGADLVHAHIDGQLPDWSLVGTELLTFRPGRIDDPASIPDQVLPLLRVADLLESPVRPLY
jgi:hypothetical protein